MTDSDAAERGLEIRRVFDAPRETVFQALTEPERLMRWWGPKDFTWVGCTMDLRPGGMFHYRMRSPDGQDSWGKWLYRSIDPPVRLVFVSSFADEHGNTVRAPFNAHWPLEILNTLELSEQRGKTTLTLRGEPINATEEERRTFDTWRPSIQQGFAGTFDTLDDYLREA